MSILVLGCGRTGTNMLLESLRGSSSLTASFPAEDKSFFRSTRRVFSNYLSKCDTWYIDDFNQIDSALDKNPHLKILWTIRDLRDCSLSKIYRGQPGKDTNLISDDATFEGCLEDIDWMFKVYDYISKNHSEKIMLIKMEDVILRFKETIQRACHFCGIEFEEEMRNFTDRYRGSLKTTKGKRYKSLDKNQVALYKRRYEIYNGFYKNHDIDLDLLFSALEKYQKEFNYT
tara:strand:+ start:198 stop:887 length:690 start_codon:yes stop_codon:yes gene_type:complete